MAVIAVVFAAVALICAPAASAATTLGAECNAFFAAQKTVMQTVSGFGTTIETKEPGVVTGWEVSETSILEARNEKLKIFVVVANEMEALAESSTESVVPEKANEFAARIPVPAGARIGAYSNTGVAICRTNSSDRDAFLSSDLAVGTRSPFTETSEFVPSLQATVEPDADGDGYGDETQDGCPESAASHTTCPPPPGGGSPTSTPPSSSPAGTLALSLESRLEGNVVVALVASSQQAPVTVTGSLKGKPVTGPATVAVAPGQIARVHLRLPQGVKRSLAKLPKKRRLHLVLEATATSAGGAMASANTEQRLPGRKQPRHPRHHRPY